MLPYRKNTAPSAGQTEKWGGRVAKDTIKLVAQNKKAHFEYFLEELFEAGLSLSGTEVKSLRLGKCSLKDMHSGDQLLLTPEEAVAAIRESLAEKNTACVIVEK